MLLVESLIHFGRSPDGSVERDLRHAIATLTKELAEARKVIERVANGISNTSAKDYLLMKDARDWLERNKATGEAG